MKKLIGTVLLVTACGEVKDKNDEGTFALALDATSALVRENGSIEIEVTVTRDNIPDPIAINVTGLPEGVSADPLEIAEDGTTGTLVINAALPSTHGRATLQVSGVATLDAEITADAPALSLLVGGGPGVLDRSFASDGTFTPTLAGLSTAGRSLAITEQGIVVTGFVVANPTQVMTARVLEDGTLDPAYGGTGFVSTGVPGSSAQGIAIAGLPDGGVIVAGIGGGVSPELDMSLFKYSATGVLDAGFGTGGVQTFNPGAGTGEWHTISIGSDGSLVLAGNLFGGTTSMRVAKFSGSTGEQDNTYNIVESDIIVRASTLQADGKLLIAGTVGGNYVVTRYDTASIFDASFQTDAIDFSGLTDTVHGIHLMPDGKVFVIGISAQGGNGPSSISMARFNTNGSLDATFGSAGKILTTIPFESRANNAIAVTDTHVYFAGRRSTDDVPAVARFDLATGAPDLTFGDGGLVVIDFGVPGTGTTTGAFGVGIDAEGRVVVSADVGPIGTQSIGVARLWF